MCYILEDKKRENVSLWKLVDLLKQQTQDTRKMLSTDVMNVEAVLTNEQRLQLIGDLIYIPNMYHY